MENLNFTLHQDYSYFAFGKWFYYPERVACIKRGDFREVMPVTVQLVPSLYCNFNCPRCCYGRSKGNIKAIGDRKAMLMDADTMIAIIDRLSGSGIKGILFTGGGEPTVNPHLIDGMRHAVQKGLKVGLFTNGSLLTDTKILQLLELEPTFIRISLDAGTPEVHRLIHGYSNKHNYLPGVLENVERLAKGKLHQKSNTTIGVGVTVEPVNLNNLIEVANRLREIVDRHPCGGVDYLAFRPTVNYQGGKSIRAAQPVLAYLEHEIPEYYEAYSNFMHGWTQLPADLFAKANLVINREVSQILRNTGIQVINIYTKMLGISQATRPFRKCRASPWYIFIGPEGTVYNCVDLGLDPRVSIGNLLTQSLDEIWKSRRRQEVMDFIDNDGLHTLCPPVCVNYELNDLFEKLDEAIHIAGNGGQKILEWIDEQQAHVQAETASGVYSQPHREFM